MNNPAVWLMVPFALLILAAFKEVFFGGRVNNPGLEVARPESGSLTALAANPFFRAGNPFAAGGGLPDGASRSMGFDSSCVGPEITSITQRFCKPIGVRPTRSAFEGGVA